MIDIVISCSAGEGVLTTNVDLPIAPMRSLPILISTTPVIESSVEAGKGSEGSAV